ncbi:uncharacterized protein V1510DRAFT_419401 [Dipodascopsis tothii]|uniref:uncharacterized protein n=1 Tax=Dipodascopsis tothii TaxID=44089 RepID=UPI0034CD0940
MHTYQASVRLKTPQRRHQSSTARHRFNTVAGRGRACIDTMSQRGTKSGRRSARSRAAAASPPPPIEEPDTGRPNALMAPFVPPLEQRAEEASMNEVKAEAKAAVAAESPDEPIVDTAAAVPATVPSARPDQSDADFATFGTFGPPDVSVDSSGEWQRPAGAESDLSLTLVDTTADTDLSIGNVPKETDENIPPEHIQAYVSRASDDGDVAELSGRDAQFNVRLPKRTLTAHEKRLYSQRNGSQESVAGRQRPRAVSPGGPAGPYPASVPLTTPLEGDNIEQEFARANRALSDTELAYGSKTLEEWEADGMRLVQQATDFMMRAIGLRKEKEATLHKLEARIDDYAQMLLQRERQLFEERDKIRKRARNLFEDVGTPSVTR